jgi:hypothetical protein
LYPAARHELRLDQFVDIQFAVLIDVEPVEFGFHETPELLSGDFAAGVAIRQEKQLLGVGFAGNKLLFLPFGVGTQRAAREQSGQHRHDQNGFQFGHYSLSHSAEELVRMPARNQHSGRRVAIPAAVSGGTDARALSEKTQMRVETARKTGLGTHRPDYRAIAILGFSRLYRACSSVG